MSVFSCPLCCNENFDSKEELIAHLTKVQKNLRCSCCSKHFSSLSTLITHLSSLCVVSNDPDKKVVILKDQLIKSDHFPNTIKSCKDVGILDKREYVMLDDAHPDPFDESLENNVVKQNEDGTVSITSVKNAQTSPFIVPDQIVTITEEDKIDKNVSNAKEEMYTCNTCGVIFTSVLEHIEQFHNNQDVVVEVNDSVDSAKFLEGNTNVQMNLISESDFNKEKEKSKRFIDESGLIINSSAKNADVEDLKTLKKLPYHQVIVKELVTVDGSQKKTVYYCTVCNVGVTELNDFRLLPCKTRLLDKLKKGKVKIDKNIQYVTNYKAEKSIVNQFVCEICNTQFGTNKSLKLHRRMHDPLKVQQIAPPVEDNKGKEILNTVERYFCNECKKIIPLAYKDVHTESHKTGEIFHCNTCNKKFPSQDFLVMHMNNHIAEKPPVKKTENKDLPYKCVYCEKQFARPHEKVKHERIHTGEKPHSCEICGKTFRVAYCLTLHMRTHTGARPYACATCGKKFKAQSVYNHHIQTHSDVRAYKCPYCPKAFKTSVQLAGHKNSHTKPFSCKHCNRPFSSLYAVRIHTETHRRRNTLKFSCSVCGASYARAFALKDHMKQAHNTEGPAEMFDVNVESPYAVDEKAWEVLGDGDVKMSGKNVEDSLEFTIHEEALPKLENFTKIL